VSTIIIGLGIAIIIVAVWIILGVNNKKKLKCSISPLSLRTNNFYNQKKQKCSSVKLQTYERWLLLDEFLYIL